MNVSEFCPRLDVILSQIHQRFVRRFLFQVEKSVVFIEPGMIGLLIYLSIYMHIIYH